MVQCPSKDTVLPFSAFFVSLGEEGVRQANHAFLCRTAPAGRPVVLNCSRLFVVVLSRAYRNLGWEAAKGRSTERMMWLTKRLTGLLPWRGPRHLPASIPPICDDGISLFFFSEFLIGVRFFFSFCSAKCGACNFFDFFLSSHSFTLACCSAPLFEHHCLGTRVQVSRANLFKSSRQRVTGEKAKV